MTKIARGFLQTALTYGFCHFMALALWLWHYASGPIAPYSCFKKFWKIDKISHFFYLFLHIKLQLSVKLRCVGSVLPRPWMFLVPYYFYVSYQENHTEGGHKLKRKLETMCLFKRPVLEL